jgi:hypothetical protein
MTTVRRLPAKGKTMEALLTLIPSRGKTRLLLTSGKDVLLEGKLPPLNKVLHARAVVTLFEALALWMDTRLCVALYADDEGDFFRLNLTDEFGVGARGVFHAVKVLARSPRRWRRAVAERGTEQLPLAAAPGGAR